MSLFDEELIKDEDINQLDKDGYPHDSVQVNREGNNQNEEEIKNLPNNEEIEVGSGENQKEEEKEEQKAQNEEQQNIEDTGANPQDSNSNSNRKSGNTNENEDKNNYQLSTIKNENANSNNSDIVEEEKKNFIGQMSEDSYNLIKNLQNQDLTGNERFNVNVQNKNSGENVEEKPKDENEN